MIHANYFATTALILWANPRPCKTQESAACRPTVHAVLAVAASLALATQAYTKTDAELKQPSRKTISLEVLEAKLNAIVRRYQHADSAAERDEAIVAIQRDIAKEASHVTVRFTRRVRDISWAENKALLHTIEPKKRHSVPAGTPRIDLSQLSVFTAQMSKEDATAIKPNATLRVVVTLDFHPAPNGITPPEAGRPMYRVMTNSPRSFILGAYTTKYLALELNSKPLKIAPQ